jgi:hypothetical protein
LTLWNWIEAEYLQNLNCNFFTGTHKIYLTLWDLRLSVVTIDQGGHNKCFAVEHRDEYLPGNSPDTYTVGERTYRVRGKRLSILRNLD